MKEFKDKLKEELRQDAPFTNDIKQRILQKKPIKESSTGRLSPYLLQLVSLLG